MSLFQFLKVIMSVHRHNKKITFSLYLFQHDYMTIALYFSTVPICGNDLDIMKKTTRWGFSEYLLIFLFK